MLKTVNVVLSCSIFSVSKQSRSHEFCHEFSRRISNFYFGFHICGSSSKPYFTHNVSVTLAHKETVQAYIMLHRRCMNRLPYIGTIFRDYTNPLDTLSDGEIIQRYRLDRSSIIQLIMSWNTSFPQTLSNPILIQCTFK